MSCVMRAWEENCFHEDRFIIAGEYTNGSQVRKLNVINQGESDLPILFLPYLVLGLVERVL